MASQQNATRIATAASGPSIASSETSKAPLSSPVETTALPSPPVAIVDSRRSSRRAAAGNHRGGPLHDRRQIGHDRGRCDRSRHEGRRGRDRIEQVVHSGHVVRKDLSDRRDEPAERNRNDDLGFGHAARLFEIRQRSLCAPDDRIKRERETTPGPHFAKRAVISSPHRVEAGALVAS
jgi:hypothetical protein